MSGNAKIAPVTALPLRLTISYRKVSYKNMATVAPAPFSVNTLTRRISGVTVGAINKKVTY
jgi:hypothetical protein